MTFFFHLRQSILPIYLITIISFLELSLLFKNTTTNNDTLLSHETVFIS